MQRLPHMAHQFMLSPVELGGATSPHLIMGANDLLLSNLIGLRWHLFIIFFKNLFLALLGLPYTRAFSSHSEWGLLSGCSAPASHCGGFSSWSTDSGARAQNSWHTGLADLCHVGSSWTRGRQTHVPCIGRQILNHWTTGKSSLLS